MVLNTEVYFLQGWHCPNSHSSTVGTNHFASLSLLVAGGSAVTRPISRLLMFLPLQNVRIGQSDCGIRIRMRIRKSIVYSYKAYLSCSFRLSSFTGLTSLLCWTQPHLTASSLALNTLLHWKGAWLHLLPAIGPSVLRNVPSRCWPQQHRHCE